MLCVNCKTQLPDGASFCWNCGKPQGENIRVDEPKWEICEIDWNTQLGCVYGVFLGYKGHFVAKAIGPNGVYIAAKTKPIALGYGGILFSDRIPSKSDKGDVATYEALVAHLVKEGWQPSLVPGDIWWKSRFQRRVK